MTDLLGADGGRVLSRVGYGRLVEEVGELLSLGKAAAEAAAGHQLALTYWKVGRRISEEGLSERAGYQAGVMGELAEDLGISVRNLQHALRFARLYEEPPQPGLSWAHYRALLSVPEQQARRALAAQARELGWSRRQLAEAIAEGVAPDEAGAGSGESELTRPTDGNYLYRCEVARVIDGDTLLAHVDLGFDVIRVQRMRLVHVQAEAAKTKAGKAASRFLRETLAQARTVVVKTARSSDARGRYLAYVFYSGQEADAETVFREGTYLNAELVARGYATVFRDPGGAP
jgi:endonuclease YncB( thermonuclease family)